MKYLYIKESTDLLTNNKWYDVIQIAQAISKTTYILIKPDIYDYPLQWIPLSFFKTIDQVREEKLNELLN
jgi:hypothetical protein